MKKQKNKIMKSLRKISKPALKLLNIGASFITASSLLLLGFIYEEYTVSPSCALIIYSPMIEYILVSIILLIGGAAILDRSLRE